MDSRQSPFPEDASPPRELRERVLSRCRREMAGRLADERRRQRRWQWSMAAGVVGLLLLNAVEEGRSAARIERLMAGGVRIAQRPRPSASRQGLLRIRVTHLATLLRDPNAL